MYSTHEKIGALHVFVSKSWTALLTMTAAMALLVTGCQSDSCSTCASQAANPGTAQMVREQQPAETMVPPLDWQTTPRSTNAWESSRYDPVQADPPADAAVQIRNWGQSVSSYQTGNFVAGPIYKIPVADLSQPCDNDWIQLLLEPLAFVGQSAATPVWACVQWPWSPVEYHAVQFPPSMTGSLALMPSSATQPCQACDRPCQTCGGSCCGATTQPSR